MTVKLILLQVIIQLLSVSPLISSTACTCSCTCDSLRTNSGVHVALTSAPLTHLPLHLHLGVPPRVHLHTLQIQSPSGPLPLREGVPAVNHATSAVLRLENPRPRESNHPWLSRLQWSLSGTDKLGLGIWTVRWGCGECAEHPAGRRRYRRC